jgi:hypothetical protein
MMPQSNVKYKFFSPVYSITLHLNYEAQKISKNLKNNV